MIDVVHIIDVDLPSVGEQLAEIFNVLLHDACHVFKLCKLMAAMPHEHALCADQHMANFAEVLDLLLRVP